MRRPYEEALSSLARVPLEEFVAARKRLATELKAEGDKEAAARLAKVARPSLSVWAVNQLWWRANEPFQQLFGLAARLRRGDRGAAGAHREQLAALRTRAAELLRASGHAAAEPTLRRVSINLAALAASGGFDPDPPGALAADRDPPGFDAMELAPSSGASVHVLEQARARRGAAASALPAAAPRAPVAEQREPPERKRAQAAGMAEARRAQEERRALAEAERERAQREARRVEAEQRRAEAEARRRADEERRRAEAERKRAEEERARKQQLRRALEADLFAAKRALAPHERRVERLRGELHEAERELEAARQVVAALEQRLAALRT